MSIYKGAPTQTQNYNVNSLENEKYNHTDGIFNSPASNWHTLEKIEIENNSIIIDNDYTMLQFWDINDNYLGYYADDDSGARGDLGGYPGTGDVSSFIPNNAYYFAVGFRSDSPTFWEPDNFSFSYVENFTVDYNIPLQNIYYGQTLVPRVYLGGALVYETPPPSSYYLSFDGVDDYVDIPTAAILTGNSNYDISITFIKKGQNAQNNENAWLYFYNPTVPSSANGLILGSNSNLIVSWWGQDLGTSFIIQDDVEYTIRQTYDGTTRKIYVNGNEIATDNPSPRSGTSKNDFALGIRTSDNQRGLNGEIFDFRVFNSIQSQSTMESDLTGNESGLVVTYDFNEGNGTTLNDLSPNNYDGTINGATWVEE